jgi:hypothetical protein
MKFLSKEELQLKTLDELIAYKSLLLLMQKKSSEKENAENQLALVKESAETKAKELEGYKLISVKENSEQTALAKLTDDMFLIRKLNNMIGYIRMFINKNKYSNLDKEETQQESMAKLQLKRYEKVLYSTTEIERILGRDVVAEVLGIELGKFGKGNARDNSKIKH